MASRLERSLQPVVRGAQWYGNRAQGVREGLLQGEGEEGSTFNRFIMPKGTNSHISGQNSVPQEFRIC